MELATLDWVLIISFFSIVLAIGIIVSKKSGKNTSEYFLSNRSMPWWLLGFSMVATTFSTDTPNLVTDIVRNNGVSGNWVWWAFLLTGLLTVFVYAKLWRKSNVNTDMEFYDLRYGGKPAHFLRGFRSIYLGVIFNIMAMAAVTLAAIKIGQVMLGLSPVETVLIAGTITVIFSALGGFRGVVYTDFVLFFVAIAGAIGAAYYLVNLPEVGGLSKLITHGKNRKDAINKMIDAIDNYHVLGISTTLSFGRYVMTHDAFVSGKFDTHFVQNHFSPANLFDYQKEVVEAATIFAGSYIESDKQKYRKAYEDNKQPLSAWRTKRIR